VCCQWTLLNLLLLLLLPHPSPFLSRCHVMERESFESEETAAILNKHFISVKVLQTVASLVWHTRLLWGARRSTQGLRMAASVLAPPHGHLLA
jgi:hypothetical protein